MPFTLFQVDVSKGWRPSRSIDILISKLAAPYAIMILAMIWRCTPTLSCWMALALKVKLFSLTVEGKRNVIHPLPSPGKL